jgi:hypothetical protein
LGSSLKLTQLGRSDAAAQGAIRMCSSFVISVLRSRFLTGVWRLAILIIGFVRTIFFGG